MVCPRGSLPQPQQPSEPTEWSIQIQPGRKRMREREGRKRKGAEAERAEAGGSRRSRSQRKNSQPHIDRTEHKPITDPKEVQLKTARTTAGEHDNQKTTKSKRRNKKKQKQRWVEPSGGGLTTTHQMSKHISLFFWCRRKARKRPQNDPKT
jgi:hypothetical protein